MPTANPAHASVLSEIHYAVVKQACRLYALGYADECLAIVDATKHVSKLIEVISDDATN